MEKGRSNKFKRALTHLKSTTIDEKLQLLNEVPTNSTSGIYTDEPREPTTTTTELNPNLNPLDLTQDDSSTDTTGLFMPDGTILTEEPPGDTSYILGPMAAMYYTWSYPWTMVGYIRQSDRKFVNLGRIDGKLSDWTGTEGDANSGTGTFNSYGQLTLEQAVWFRDIQKQPGATNDPSTYNYYAFYPGPPSQTPDADGRYPCVITGVSKRRTETTTGETPGTMKGIEDDPRPDRWETDKKLRNKIYDKIQSGELSGLRKKLFMKYMFGDGGGEPLTEKDLTSQEVELIRRNVQQLLDKGDGIFSTRGGDGPLPPIKQDITNQLSDYTKRQYGLKQGDRLYQMSSYFDRNRGKAKDIKNNDVQTLFGNFVAITDSNDNLKSVRDDFDFEYGLERADSGLPGSPLLRKKKSGRSIHPGQGLMGGETGGVFDGSRDEPIITKFGRAAVNMGAAFGRGNPVPINIDFNNSKKTRKEEVLPCKKLVKENKKKKKIIQEIKKPYVVKEIKQEKLKGYRPRVSGGINTELDKLMQKAENPTTFKPMDETVWTKQDKYYNARLSQERKNEVLDHLGTTGHYWQILTETGRKSNEKAFQERYGDYKVVRKEQLTGDTLLLFTDENGNKESMLQSDYQDMIAKQIEEPLYEQGKLNVSKDPLIERIKNKLGDYPNKPSKDGYPNEPPPKMVNGRHPEYGKRSDYYNRLDPHSAKSMPTTGDSEIDAKVASQKSSSLKPVRSVSKRTEKTE